MVSPYGRPRDLNELLSTTGSEPGRLLATAENDPNKLKQFGSFLINPLVDLPDQTNPFLRALEYGAESLTSPLGIATAVLAPVTGGTSLGLRGALGAAVRLGSVAAAETAVGAAAGTAAREVSERLPEGTPGAVRLGLSLGAGVAAGGAATAGVRAAFNANKILATTANEAVDTLSATPATLGVTSDEAAELTLAIRNARTLGRREQAAVRRQVLGQRTGQAESLYRTGATELADPSVAMRESTTALRGELPSVRFEAPKLGPDTTLKLKNQIKDFQGLDYWDFKAGYEGLDKVLAGSVPHIDELRILNRVFGEGFTQAVLDRRSVLDKLMLAINAPRSLMTSADFSAPLRQGILLAGANPKEFAQNFKPMIKAFFNDDYYKQAVGAIGEERLVLQAKLAEAFGQPAGSVVSTKMLPAVTDTFLDHEELFMGSGLFGRGFLHESLAGAQVRASERAYALYLSKLRHDIFKKQVGKWLDSGDLTKDRVESLTTVLNVFTGRGDYKVLEGKAGQLLSSAFFAPRFTLDRFRAPTLLLTETDPEVRKFIAKQLGGFLATGTTFLGLMAAAKTAGLLPDFRVETDPRSSDFGKGRVGSQRFDFWGGYSQIARTFARVATGQSKSASGSVRDINRFQDALWDQFIRSKTSPQIGLAWNVTTGSNFIGDKVEFTDVSVAEQARSLVVPISIQDIMEGFKEEGLVGAAATLPSLFGVGVTSYRSLAEVRDIAADNIFNKQYYDLTGPERQIVDQDPKVLSKIAEYDLKVEDSYSKTVQNYTEERLLNEATLMAGLMSGRFSDRKSFADALADEQLKASVRRQDAIARFGIPAPDPTSPLQIALSGWYDLYQQADIGADRGVVTGHVDWELFGQLEEAYLKGLTPEQRDFIDNRVTASHDKTVEWFYNNKEYIRKSGYFDYAEQFFSRYARPLAKYEITTYGQLKARYSAAKYAGDRREERILGNYLRRIESAADNKKKALRRRDPKLDRALFENGVTSTLLTRAARELGGALTLLANET